MTERLVTTPDGTRLWTQALGPADGVPLLLIMGANTSAMGWPQEFLDLLTARGLRVVRYDHRDTGRSTHYGITHYGVRDLAEDAVAVLDGHGIGTAHVAGMSLGGVLGQLLALDYRDRLRSLTLMQTAALDVDFAGAMRRALEGTPAPGDLPTPTPEIVRATAQRADPAPDRETALRRRVEQWRLLAGTALPFHAEEFRRWENTAIDHAGTHQQPAAHAAATPVPTSRGRELAGVSTPTLVVQGPEDPVNPPPHGRHLASLIPGARCLEIPGLGHALPSALHPALVTALTDHIGAHP
ncbi:10-carbomethoxy-13-deoxycarminomycin esterase/esterase [Saccharopolyspora erythraea NRRL 2338]|uniref:Hydrolase, alpha/beta fold family n=2 Tax=Saccharopolyspora erythraea TaxID=1836 RepID=A4FFY1_SACEN|nr:alpha/beta fold hydrolase [Saccharopolyspora erythraea]EQD84015.1 alpha/beta hydrolase [Saccharopolyspora erythraea D]PFG96662.1 10-carbomethoxy-13-deoxycarminomycin esterase/esterase [Saccharopolyspora erythraea NRRL 2338]QRK93142.1 alpha/beta fold hydrolase [Saccharopolyspora erythraea]CAM02956.1 hydrolase, alpha/beta fold family [Saccharopolyspora erythraea NRRL 2338]